MQRSVIFVKNFLSMILSEIELFEALSEQLGKDKARTLVQFVETKIENGLDDKKSGLTTREEILVLKQDIAKLDTKLSQTKAEIIRWVFAFFFALTLFILGLYFKS